MLDRLLHPAHVLKCARKAADQNGLARKGASRLKELSAAPTP